MTPTTREEEALALVLRGQSIAQMAQALFLSEHAVRHHIDRLRYRHGVHTLRELMAVLWEQRVAGMETRALTAEAKVAQLEQALAAIDRRGRGG